MIARGTAYADLGSRYFDLRDRDRTERRALATLRNLGYHVTLSPSPTPTPAASLITLPALFLENAAKSLP